MKDRCAIMVSAGTYRAPGQCQKRVGLAPVKIQDTTVPVCATHRKVLADAAKHARVATVRLRAVPARRLAPGADRLTDKTPPRRPRQTRRDPRPLTFGDVLGAALEADRAAKARRAELDDMGFRPVGGDVTISRVVKIPKGWP